MNAKTLIATVEARGGVYHRGGGELAVAGAPLEHNLANDYVAACETEGREPLYAGPWEALEMPMNLEALEARLAARYPQADIQASPAEPGIRPRVQVRRPSEDAGFDVSINDPTLEGVVTFGIGDGEDDADLLSITEVELLAGALLSEAGMSVAEWNKTQRRNARRAAHSALHPVR